MDTKSMANTSAQTLNAAFHNDQPSNSWTPWGD